MTRLRARKLSTRLMYLVNSIALAFLVSSGLIIGGCKFSARAGSDSEDLQEAQKVAEQFLQHLKDEKYDAAYELGASRLKSLITRESLQTDIQGRQRGGPVQSWTFKSHQITAVVPRQL